MDVGLDVGKLGSGEKERGEDGKREREREREVNSGAFDSMG